MRGTPKDWTLDELNLVWEFDGEDGTSIDSLCDGMEIARGTWYSIKARLRSKGGPQALYDDMQESKKTRYNRGAAGRSASGAVDGRTDTLGEALSRRYLIRISGAGRERTQEQFTVTIPPALAAPFIEQWGRDVTYEPREDGILIKPLRVAEPEEIPGWLTARASLLALPAVPLSEDETP